VTAMVADMAGTPVPDPRSAELDADSTHGQSGAMMVAPMIGMSTIQVAPDEIPRTHTHSSRLDFNDVMFDDTFGAIENMDAIHGAFDLIGFEMNYQNY